jgi:uncharacterized membrane protein
MRGDVEPTTSISSQKDDVISNQQVHEQLQHLSTQLGSVRAQTTSLKAQHAACRETSPCSKARFTSVEGLLRDTDKQECFTK